MPKALLFNIPSSGHVNPTLPIIEQLAHTELEIVYVNTETERAKVEATGTRFIAYPPNEILDAFFDNVPFDNFSANALALYRIGKALLPFALDLIEREKPDFIIFDSLANWGKTASHLSDTPAIGFVSTFLITPEATPSLPLKTILMTIPQLLAVLPSYFGVMWQMWREYHAPPIFILDLLMSLSDTNIVFTSKAFQPSGDKLGDKFQFVGACIGKRTDDPDFPFDLLRDDVPKLYISLGTIVQNNIFLKRCFEAFGESDLQVIMSVGQQTDIARLGTIPDNFIVKGFVPQLDILERVDAFVTHSGMNSVHEALLASVPLIAIPQQPEQAMVAQQIDTLGAGIGLQLAPPYGDVTVDDLVQAVDSVLTDSHYSEKAKGLGQSLRDAGGVEQAVSLLLRFAETKSFK